MSTVARAQGIFASRTFSLFYAGQALSYVGDGLRTLAIPLLVYHLTGSAISLGVTYALEFLPFALFGPIGGALADRLDRRRLMLLCDFICFLVIALFALAYARGVLTLPWLYAGIAIIATCAAFFIGGQSPSIPFLLGKDRASPAVAALIAAEQGANLIVPPIGGALFALVGPLPALAINAFTYLTSQLSLYALPTLGPDVPGRMPTVRELVADVSEGFRIVLADDAMRAVAMLSGALNFFGIMAFAAIIPFLERDLGASTTQVGLSFGVIAAGSMIGSLVAGRYGRRWPFGKSLVIAYAIDAFLKLNEPANVARTRLELARLRRARGGLVAAIGRQQRIGEKGVLDVGEDQFLVLLLVMQADLQDAQHFSERCAFCGGDQLRH